MGNKKRPSTNLEELDGSKDPNFDKENQFAAMEKTEPLSIPESMKPMERKPMERKKKRKTLDKKRHRLENKPVPVPPPAAEEAKKPSGALPIALSMGPALHVKVFDDLSSADASVRRAAAEALVMELMEVQSVYEKVGDKGAAKKDYGLENCAEDLGYAVSRLIQGVASSNKCVRQGFALALTILLAKISAIKTDSLMKLVDKLLEVSSAMRGQDARENLLGRLFAYGSLARSGRLAAELMSDSSTSTIDNFISHVISLADKKRYLREPAVSIILDMAEKVPLEALLCHVLNAPGIHEWFQKAADVGDPDALFLALKLQERVPVDAETFSKILPYPFNPDNFFARDHLLYLVPCFKESTFCLPRVHSLWPLVVNLLLPDATVQDDDTIGLSASSKKHKKSQKGSSSEEITKNVRSFCEVVIEESLLVSSHDRKHLALNVLLLLFPRLAASCIQIVLSHKLVHCLMDILSTKGSWLYDAGQHFLKELFNWVGNDDDRRVAVLLALQKHSNGRFDCITRTQTVKDLVARFNTAEGCLLFVHNLMNLFVDEGSLTDEPSDQSQTTDENSEIGSAEDKDSPGASGSMDLLKTWVIDIMPRVLKNLKLDSNAKCWADTEIVKFIESKFRVQAEIMKFLAVQGLFSASLGTEVTSFELQEKFKWPKAATSNSLCMMCIQQLQSLLEDAQRGEVSNLVSNSLERNDLGSYFMCFLNTLCNIPSVSLYRELSSEDDKAFKKLQAVETRLLHEERNTETGLEANKLHAVRYLLIQLVLQVLLRPGEFSEAAMELSICCKKAFPAIARDDSEEEEEEESFDGNDMPDMMDVLVETFLSLLPHSSGPTCFAIEQVFRLFCDDVSVEGLLRMLRVVRKDLKPIRHRTATSDDDDGDDDYDEDDDFLEIEDKEETDKSAAVEAVGGSGHTDDSEGMPGVETTGGEVTKEVEDDSEAETSDEEVTQNDNDLSTSDGSVSDLDDDAMLKKDAHLAEFVKERIMSGKDSALTQLKMFKTRVLSLLEIYLQKNPAKPQVLMIYLHLVQAFVKYHVVKDSQQKLTKKKKDNQQLGDRIQGILQKRIFKAKDYPRGDDITLASLEPMLEKSLRSASRSKYRAVSSIAQVSTFWILKIIHSRNFPESELGKVVELFRNILVDYFQSKKCRLKSGFVKEVVRRHPWLGQALLGFLLEKCGSAKSEFRRVEALEVVDCVMRSLIPITKGDEKERDTDAFSKSQSKVLKKHLTALCELFHVLLSAWPEKQSRRAEVRRFCNRALHVISTLSLRKSFLKLLTADVDSLCESKLGDAFLSFKNSS